MPLQMIFQPGTIEKLEDEVSDPDADGVIEIKYRFRILPDPEPDHEADVPALVPFDSSHETS